MKPYLILIFLAAMSFAVTPLRSQTAPPIPESDSRFKVDILVVVGHPDDDIEVASYLARVIEQQNRRAAVVYTTRGNTGGNAVGEEQANALADIREIEARQSLASYGISLAWFLHGSDTPGSDVLHSLERWGHGKALDEVVRLVRITRPEVILTWMPNYAVGENHEDHQAAGVLATEAFDSAANPLVFPEQLEAPRDRWNINNYGEGLRPWQPKKIYYFSDATNLDFLKGKGPEYRSDDISPSRKVPYSRVAAEAWRFYKTQLMDFPEPQLKEFTERPVQLIFGKSLVGGNMTADVFEGIKAGPISYSKPRGYVPPEQKLSFDLGGPWAFYRAFWRAHDIEHIGALYAPEAQVAPGESLWVPLLITNDTDRAKEVHLTAALPAGWSAQPEAKTYMVAAHDFYPIQLRVTSAARDKDTWQTLSWQAESDGQKIGSASLRINVVGNYLPQ